MNYGIRVFLFETDERLTSHVVSIGWSRQITRKATLSFEVAPW